MAMDLQVVYPQEVVRLSSVRLTRPGPLSLPASLEVFGEDFSAVDEVLINEIPSPDVLVVSRTRLIAQLPDSLRTVPSIVGVSVLSRRITLTAKSLIRFRVSDQPGRVSGILRLVQLFLKLLFTTPGTDRWSPRSGGGALRRVGATFGRDERGNVVSDFIIAVDTTSRQIVAKQSRNPRLPRSERLLSARVLSAGFNRELGGVVAGVELLSQDGRSALANLEL